MDRHVARIWEIRNAYKMLIAKPESRRKGNIKTDLMKSGCEGADWVHLTQDRD